MNNKQREKLSKVVRGMNKMINHSEELTEGYNIVAGTVLTETQVIEKALILFTTRLSDVQCELNVYGEEHQIISEVIDTFEAVGQEKQDIYFYSVIDQNGKRKYKTDRKGHIIGILEWALERITGNIDVGVI